MRGKHLLGVTLIVGLLLVVAAGAAVAATYRVEMHAGDTLAVVGKDGCTVTFRQNSASTLEVRCNGEGGTIPDPAPSEPTAAPTAEPEPTAAPSDPVQPYADAPECAPDLHDPTEYHRHWNEEAGCYYDHHHGGRAANAGGQYVVSTGPDSGPRSVDHIFGTSLWEYMGGRTIGYPHITPGENDTGYKHEQFVWFVWDDEFCESAYTDGCIPAGRVLAHVDHHNPATRHSFDSEYKVCLEADPSVCGIARFGGYTNMGSLHLDGKKVVDVPPPARKMQQCRQLYYTDSASSNWYGCAESGLGAVATEVNDTPIIFERPASVPVTDHTLLGRRYLPGCEPDADGYIPYGGERGSRCPDHSRVQAHFFTVQFLNYWRSVVDADKDGFADWSGFVTPLGDVNEICTEAGPDCVPVSFENVPVNVLYQYNGPRTEYSQTPPGAPHSWLRVYNVEHEH